MDCWRIAGRVGVAAALSLTTGAAWAASDASNSGSNSNQATTAVVAPVVSGQTSTIISNAITGGLGGGFVPTGGTGGGFSPSGGGGGGGFAPSGGGNGGGFAPSGGGNGGAGTGPSSSNQIGPTPFASTRQVGRSGGADMQRFGVWTQGTASRIVKSETALKMSGNAYNVLVGGDYKFTDKVMAGLALSYEAVDVITSYNAGRFEGSGVSVVPYVGVALSPTLSWDLAVGYGWLGYDVSRTNNTVRGSYDATRLFGATNVTGSFAAGNFRFQPRIGVQMSREESDAYNESSGARVDAGTSDSGRATVGSKIGYALESSVPYIKVLGEWDFLTPKAVLKSNGEMSSNDRLGGVVGLGYEYYWGSAVASAELNYNSLFRDNLDIATGAVRLRWGF